MSINHFSHEIEKFTYIHDLLSTCYHEAGHVIFALLRLMKVQSVRVYNTPTQQNVGYTYFDAFPAESFYDELIKYFIINSEICMRYAGVTSEKYYFKTISGSDKFPTFLRDSYSEDTKEAARLFRKFNIISPGKKRYKYKKNLLKNTLIELKDHWQEIILVAHILFKKKRLTYKILKNILTKKSNNTEFWKYQFRDIDNLYNCKRGIDEKEFKIILARCKFL